MKKINKRIISALLAFIFALPVCQVNKVFANKQSLITNLSIQDATTNMLTDYAFNLYWKQPPISPEGTNQGGNTDAPDIPAGYKLLTRNASKSGTFPTEMPADDIVTSPGPNSTLTTKVTSAEMAFEPASIYGVKVLPYHMHTYPVLIPGGGTRPVTEYAPYTKPYPYPDTNEVLYLTDIRVSAEGKNDTMTVTWDNVKFDGREAFVGYKIRYATGYANDVNLANPPVGNEVTVYDNDPNLHRMGDKLQYTFTDSTLIPGRLYTVMVNPIANTINGQKPLVSSPASVVTSIRINNKDYQFAYSERPYDTDEAYIKPALNVREYGSDKIELYWAKFMNVLDVTSLDFEMSQNETFDNKTTIATILGSSALSQSSLFTDRPKTLTYYRMKITYVIDKNTNETAVMYTDPVPFDPDYIAFKPLSPIIFEVNDNADNPLKMDITWEAFVRKPYTIAEKNMPLDQNGNIVDKNIEYDIWVSDDLTLLNSGELDNYKIIENLPATGLEELTYEVPVGNVMKEKLAYKYSDILSYAKKDKNGIRIVPLEENKIYYIKLVAKRTNVIEEQISDPAFSSHFIFPIDMINARPNIVSRPPLRIKTDANGFEEITDKSITIQWDMVWYEVYDDVTKKWYPMVAYDGSNHIYENIPDALFVSNKVTKLYDSKYTNSTITEAAAKQLIIADAHLPATAPIRRMDLKNAKYDIHVVKSEHLDAAPSFDEYVETIKDLDDMWQLDIKPTGDADHPEFVVTQEDAPEKGGLKKNTAYSIIFRPYVITADGKKAVYHPSVVSGTTKDELTDIEVIPTVPVLEPVASGDTYVVVRFIYSEALKYTLAYSELLSDYPEGGRTISSEDIVKNGTVQLENNKKYMYITVPYLFPETLYHLWLSAESASSTVKRWSNPVSIKTRDLTPPKPPQGLGLASEKHVDIYNKENSVKYMPVDFNYMIIEWLRDPKDEGKVEGATGGAGGTAEGSATEFLTSEAFLNTFMVKFNDLIGNKPYYIRAKTRLTVTKSGGSGTGEQTGPGITSYYQYVVQVSLYDDFVEYIEAIVPSELAELDPVYTISKDSEWTDTIRLNTNPYSGEYDGDKDPDMYPLPDKDYEIIYDKPSDTLTWRFRSDKTDQYGNKDQNVDQRFISKLVSKNVHIYEVDLSKYAGKEPRNRVLELPYTIIKAFNERKIKLKVVAGAHTYTLEPGFVNSPDTKDVTDYGYAAKVKINMINYSGNLPFLKAGEAYIAPPQLFNVQVFTKSKSVTLKTLASPMNVDILADHRYSLYDKNIGTYFFNGSTLDWVRNKDTFDSKTAKFNFKTGVLGSYSIIGKKMPVQTSPTDSETTNANYSLASNFLINGIEQYNPNSSVSAWQLNKVIYAVVNNQKSVNINQQLSDAEYNSLYKAGLLVTGAKTVVRDEAVSSLVKLYEIKTKYKVENYPSLSTTNYKDISQADTKYRTAMLKAEEIGFYGNSALASPKGFLTMGDMVRMIDIVVLDSQ